jgi:hypothetical protein
MSSALESAARTKLCCSMLHQLPLLVLPHEQAALLLGAVACFPSTYLHV